MKISRKQFFEMSLATVAAGSVLPALLGCGDDDDDDVTVIEPSTGGSSGGGGEVTSCSADVALNDGHTHDLTVATGDVTTDGVDVTYTTSLVENHVHEVTVTGDMFVDLASGDTVIVESSLADGHTHEVSIACS